MPSSSKGKANATNLVAKASLTLWHGSKGMSNAT